MLVSNSFAALYPLGSPLAYSKWTLVRTQASSWLPDGLTCMSQFARRQLRASFGAIWSDSLGSGFAMSASYLARTALCDNSVTTHAYHF